MSARPLHLGIVGFGRVARRYYLPALRALHGVRTIAVADPLAPSRAAARRAFPGVKICQSALELLELGPDALLVASPPSTHLTIWNQACAARVPVLMEKPFVLFDELQRADSSPEARRRLMVNFNWRFWPTYRRLGEMARGRRVGEVECAELVMHVNLRPWREVTARRLSPNEGGVLYDLGSQALDLVRFLFERDPVAVTAECSSRRWDGDRVQLRLALEGGIIVRCDLAYGERTQERVTIRGSKGTLTLDDPNTTIHVEHGNSAPMSVVALGRDALVLGYRAIRRSRSMARYSIGAALGAFVHALQRGEPFAPGFADARRNAIWLDAAARSARGSSSGSGGSHRVAASGEHSSVSTNRS